MSNFGKGFITILVFYILLALLGIGCPIRFITGISCAGCGMTRAYMVFLHGRVLQAFHYHPLFWMVPLVGVLLWKKKQLPEKMFQIILGVIIGIFLLVYVIRLIDCNDTVVTIDIKQGIFFRIATYFFEMIKKY